MIVSMCPPNYSNKKTGTEIIPATFTDHNAVAIGIKIHDADLKRGRSRWRMDPTLMTDEHLKSIRTEWVKWRNYKIYYPDIPMWWERYVKKKNIQLLIRKEHSDRATD